MSNPDTMSLPARVTVSISLLVLSMLAACDPPVASDKPAPPLPKSASGCGENGALLTELFGSIETSVGWSGSDLICENMLRPDNEGVRLRFSGDVDGGRLAFIVAIPGLRRGGDGTELPSKVTVTVEGSGRFFSTPNFDACWTDIDTLPAAADNIVPIKGSLYCVTPLGEINGDSAVAISELTFSTIVKWNDP